LPAVSGAIDCVGLALGVARARVAARSIGVQPRQRGVDEGQDDPLVGLGQGVGRLHARWRGKGHGGGESRHCAAGSASKAKGHP
jgi:hypothetical protein